MRRNLSENLRPAKPWGSPEGAAEQAPLRPDLRGAGLPALGAGKIRL
jgi:hypothetical protein